MATFELRRFIIREADWQTDGNVLSNIRRRVFIVEQRVPQEEEWDGKDESAWHWLATQDGVAIGTARLLPDGQIGRMAVLSDYRRQGVGAALLESAVAKARHLGMSSVFLNAQTHALSFYQACGFQAEGEEFEEAGTPHRRMTRSLTPVAGDSRRQTAIGGQIADVSIKQFDTLEVAWPDRGETIRKIREAVLVHELHLPESMIRDDNDEQAIHWAAEDSEGRTVGAVRMDMNGEISRLAVLANQRGKGIGFSLLEQAIGKATRFGFAKVGLNGRADLAPLFEMAGFQASGDPWEEHGHRHQRFERAIETPGEDIHPDPGRSLDFAEDYDEAIYKLGEDNRMLLLRRESEFSRVILEMSRQAQRTLKIYSPLLDHKLYDNPELREICSALARKNRYTMIEILIYDAHRIIKNGHALLEISRKLSSSISIRIVHPDYRQINHEYLLADGEGVIYRLDHENYEGYANFHDVADNNRLNREFQSAWESSLSDPNLRLLKI